MVPAGYFDLIFSVDVIHHIRDRPQYYKEAYRVLKPCGKICTVTDSEAIIYRRQPLSVYFSETIAAELERYPRLASLQTYMAAAGFKDLAETEVAFAYPLREIQAYRDKAFSSLHLISETAFQRGIERMEQDLEAGPIQGLSLYSMLWGNKL